MSGAAIEAFAGAAVAPEQCPRALAALIDDCRTGLSLRLPTLDPLCGDDPVIPALRALALSSERVRIRLLYDDHNRATALGHRLVPLARRLPSRLALRLSHPEDRDPALCFAVADQAVLFDLAGWPRPDNARLFHDRRPLAARRARWFDEQWQRARQDPELRELHL